MIARLVVLGATGDLAGRYLLPGLAALHEAGQLPESFEVVGAARDALDDEAFRERAYERLEQHAAGVAAASRQAVLGSLRYRPVDLGDVESVRRVVDVAGPGASPLAVYLALPPSTFAPTLEALAAADLPAGSRIAVEKPFGENLEEARTLNALLARLFGDTAEQLVYRVDHALGMGTVHRLIALRRGSALLEAVWDGEHIEEVQVLWEEDLALEGRAGYYDGVGALKDVLQNHMLQVLGVLAMEPPERGDARELRDRKAALLAALRPPHGGDATAGSRRARYTAGRIGDRRIPSYVDEEGVDAARCTETFAEVVFAVDAPRWQGTRFVLRAGKALGQRRKEAVVRFRPGAAGADELRIGIDDPLDIALALAAAGAEGGVRLDGPAPSAPLPAYANVLLELLSGGTAHAVRGDEAEASWRAVTPVLDAWASGAVPLEAYPAGSAGPPPRS